MVGRTRNILPLVLFFVFFSNSFAKVFIAFGYAPSYPNSTQAQYLTQYNVFGSHPNVWSGAFTLASGAESAVQGAKGNGLKAFLTIGGAGSSMSDGFRIATRPANRGSFISSIRSAITQTGADGIDFDWEYPASQEDAANYVALIKELRASLNANGMSDKKISVDYPSVIADGSTLQGALEASLLNSEFYSTIDYVNLMTYDDGGDCPNKPNHSAFVRSIENVNFWIKRGVPKEKIVMGVPFYARHCDRVYPGTENEIPAKTYSELAPSNPDLNNSGQYYFNGVTMVQNKVNWVRHMGLAGVMAWQIAQDVSASDGKSLVRAIGDSINKPAWTPSSETLPAGTIAEKWEPNKNIGTTNLIYHLGKYWMKKLQYMRNVEPINRSSSGVPDIISEVWDSSDEPFCEKIYDWQQACTYTGLRGLVYDSKCYEVPAGQTAVGSDVPGISPKWVEVPCDPCDRLKDGDAWKEGCAYNIGDVVLSQEVLYELTAAECDGVKSLSLPKFQLECWSVFTGTLSSAQEESSAISLSSTTAIQNDFNSLFDINVSGNVLNVTGEGNVQVQVLNVSGQQVRTFSHTLSANETLSLEPVNQLNAGHYYLKVSVNGYEKLINMPVY